jgi:hypothetical protein
MGRPLTYELYQLPMDPYHLVKVHRAVWQAGGGNHAVHLGLLVGAIWQGGWEMRFISVCWPSSARNKQQGEPEGYLIPIIVDSIARYLRPFLGGAGMKEALCSQGLAWRSTSLHHHQPITLRKQPLLFLLWNEWLLCLVLVCCRNDLWRLLTHLTSRDGQKTPMSLRNGTRMQETHQTQRNAIHAQGASSIQVSEAGIPPLRAQTGHRERHDPQ